MEHTMIEEYAWFENGLIIGYILTKFRLDTDGIYKPIGQKRIKF